MSRSRRKQEEHNTIRRNRRFAALMSLLLIVSMVTVDVFSPINYAIAEETEVMQSEEVDESAGDLEFVVEEDAVSDASEITKMEDAANDDGDADSGENQEDAAQSEQEEISPAAEETVDNQGTLEEKDIAAESEAKLSRSFSYSDNNIAVSVELSQEAALPEEAVFVVKEIKNRFADRSQYEDAKKEINAYAQEHEVAFDGYIFYDMHFELDGQEIEVEDGTANITINYRSPKYISGSAAEDTVRILHINETSGSSVVEDVTSDVSTNSSGKITKLNLETTSFSTFAVVNGQTVTVRLQGDENTSISDGTYYVALMSKNQWGTYSSSHITPVEVANGTGTASITVTNAENAVDAEVYLLTYKQGSYQENQNYDQNNNTLWDGTYLYRYKYETSEENGVQVVTFSNLGTIPTALSDVLGTLGPAYNFGIFTINYNQGNNDVESNVAAVNFDSNSNYNFSGNNIKFENTITVTKTYTVDGEPASGKTVTILLYKNGEEYKREEVTTGDDGTASVVFSNIESGTYDVYEEINGNLVKTNGEVNVSEDKSITVNYEDASGMVIIPSFDNYTYIENVINFGSPRGGDIVIKNKEDYEKYKDRAGVNVYQADSDEVHTRIDISSMLGQNGTLTQYAANDLMNASSGDGLTVLNISWSDLKSLRDKNFPVAESGWTLVNIDMTGCDTYFEEGQFANIQGPWTTDNTNIIWNFGDYSGTINGLFSKGIVLAPNATYRTGGVFVGNVIAETVEIDNEVHFIKSDDQKQELSASITNDEHNNAKRETVDVAGKKTWVDGENQDGKRPSKITINLLADGVQVDSKTVTEADGWAWTFTELPKYKDGKEIVYSIQEDEVDGYTASYDGYNVINTHTPETTEVAGSKTWVDNNDQDGKRPTSITINLYADGTLKESKTVTSAEKWSWNFTGLPKYQNGKPIVYTITENTVGGYISNVTGYNVTNTHAPEMVKVAGSKTWVDNENQDGKRPESITINLLADGVKVDSKTVTAADWSWKFENLSKYKNGKEITYTIEEDAVDEYTSEVNGYNVTNTHTPETTEVAGSKTWNDANNQDGKRPESITINLLADGVKVDSKTVTADDWSWKFENLPKYKNGTEINYAISEDAVEDYSTEYDGFNVKNTHTPGETSLTVTKKWDDVNNQDGIRPETITVLLLKNGKETDQTVVLSAENKWTGSFTELAKYEAGTEITYSVKEVTVEGYTTRITGDKSTGYTITNSHTPETVKVEGSKSWDDNNNQDGKRPESITIRLKADGVEVASKTVTEAGGWSWSFTDLPKNKDGKEITYTITEDAVDGYTPKVEGYNVTNTHTPDETSLAVTKSWVDNNDQDGIRPAVITVVLLKNGDETEQTLTLNEGNNWTGSFTGLAKNENGEAITYSVKEIEVDGYTTVITGNQSTGYTITNSHTPETVKVEGSKTWKDNDDQDGKRPESIIINLYADGTLKETKTVTEADGWAWTFVNLPKYKDGEEITYTITENTVEEYTSELNGYNVTNTHETETTEIPVTKVWDDSNNQDGKRPTSITVILLKNGKETEKTVTLNVANEWKDSFKDLAKYDAGKEIKYSVKEVSVEGYDSEVSGDQSTGYTITNSHTTETVKVAGSKTWDDNKNQDGKRPESITINLLADGEKVASKTVTEVDDWSWNFTELPKYKDGKEISYSITEEDVTGYTSEVMGYNVTNTHTTETVEVAGSKTWKDNNDQDGKRPTSIVINLYADGTLRESKTVTEADGWAWTFVDLPKYENGKEITYTIAEDAVTDYTSKVSGYNVTNTHETETIEVAGSKTWVDNDNQDGKRPESITINLLADGVKVDSKTVTADDWSWKFENLPKYKNGTEINYAISEDAVEDYSTEYDGFNVKNTHTPGETSLTVTKAWDDANNQDGIRPESITVVLLKDGKETDQTLVLSAENKWTGSFTKLAKYEAGTEITYSVKEVSVEGYDSEVTGDQNNGYTITNSHTPETVKVAGSKSWDDNDNQDGKRPESITIRLKADGEQVDVKTVTEKDDWSWSFTDLPKNKDGKEITYTITEDTVDGYTSNVDGYNVTNTHTPGKTSLSVTKAWDDVNNQDGIRPESITVILLKNGKETDQTVTLNADNKWASSFTGLPEYENGEKITYSVKEIKVDGYTTVITGNQSTGYTITNSHTPETVKVEGGKTWKDNENQDGKRPESIIINLYADGTLKETKTVTGENGWSWSFTNLPKYKDQGTEIVYTITENAVEEYTSEVNGYNVTNTHTPETVQVEGSKTWKDANNQDGKRPASIIINLLANGKQVASKTVTEADGWAWTFANLPKYENGKEITYTITENTVEEYTSEVNGYSVTNTHTPETVEVEGSKTWDDANNQDGKRPASITIRLLADGKQVDSKTVTKEDKWSWNFTSLPKYKDGKEIAYSITEDAVDEYSAEYEGYNVTNTHTPGETSLTVTKAWDDSNNQDGIRPDSITVVLLKNGEKTDQTLTLSVDNQWTGSFTGLPEYEAGEVITYSVQEITVEGYETVITGDQSTGYVITNSHTTETVEAAGSKTWVDSDNQDGKRPTSITINLLADGTLKESRTVTEADDWSWSFTDLPKYKDQGTEIIYSITEDAVDGYSTEYDGFNVTNTHTPGETSLTVVKTWKDRNNKDGIRPESITVVLLKNGEETGQTLILSDENKWTGSFTGLSEYENGKAIAYTVKEIAVEGYTTVITGDQSTGYTITNSHTPKSTNPDTGDNSMMMLWSSLLILSMALLMILIFMEQNNRRRRIK